MEHLLLIFHSIHCKHETSKFSKIEDMHKRFLARAEMQYIIVNNAIIEINLGNNRIPFISKNQYNFLKTANRAS